MEYDNYSHAIHFHNSIREVVLLLLLGFLLYSLAFLFICHIRHINDRVDYYAGDDEDVLVYRIVLWICTFSLAVCFGTVLLLPMSVVSNEILLYSPNSYYLQWLNNSLVRGLWNTISLLSNISLFLGIPFAYFLLEAEGFPGSRKGVLSRVKETSVTLVLFGIVIGGLAWVMSALMGFTRSSEDVLMDVFDFYLPYLYSCVSLCGVAMLLVCTPVGFGRLFAVLGDLVVKPQRTSRLEDDLYVLRLEKEHLRYKLQYGFPALGSGAVLPASADILSELVKIEKEIGILERSLDTSGWLRNLFYPLLFLLLAFLTCVAVLFVAGHAVELLIDDSALDVTSQEFILGITSLSALGFIGVAVEILLIMYLVLAALVGLYSLPGLRILMPHRNDTNITRIIVNCALWIVLSSAFPVLVRTLGVTKFDLIGNHFNQIEWLSNFYMILFYNIAFGTSSALCLFYFFTGRIRRELYHRVHTLWLSCLRFFWKFPPRRKKVRFRSRYFSLPSSRSPVARNMKLRYSESFFDSKTEDSVNDGFTSLHLTKL